MHLHRLLVQPLAGRKTRLAALAVSLLLAATVAQAQTPQEEEFFAAVRRGDLAAVKAHLDQGISPNAKFRYGTTALFPACDRGHLEIVKLLLERGAEVNVRDTFYNATPLTWAASKGHVAIILLLLDKGAQGVDNVLNAAVGRDNVELLKALLARGGLSDQGLTAALTAATRGQKTEMVKLLEAAGAKPAPKADFQVDAETLASYAGTYRNEMGNELVFTLREGRLVGGPAGQSLLLNGLSKTAFRPGDNVAVTITFRVEEGKVTGVMLNQGGNEIIFKRVEDKKQ